MVQKKKATVGGFREGSGRKPVLQNPVKKLFRLEPRHIKVLERYAASHRMSGGCNEALRDILDSYEFT